MTFDEVLQRASNPLKDEERIIWLRPPESMDYVREFITIVPSRQRCPGRKRIDGAELVGYAVLRRNVKSIRHCHEGEVWHSGDFERRLFFLKPYDRPNDPSGIYATGCPAEGVDPLTVKPGVRGVKNDRAWWGDTNRTPIRTNEKAGAER